MLNKLRSRHPIDLPVELWKTTKGLLAILVGVAALFLGLPLLGALYYGLRAEIVGIGVAVGTLALVLLVGAIIGRPGHGR